MPRVELHKRDIHGDPVPTFATDDEIRAAEQLRHQLEERYLARPWATAPSPTTPNEGERR